MSVFPPLAHLPWYGCLLAFATGAVIGRALGMLVQHMAQVSGLGTIRYRRLGPKWGALPIAGHFLVPRGDRSPRALLIEVITAIAFCACWMCFPAAKAACGCVFLAALIGASFIDLDHLIIPDLFTVGLALIGLALSLLVPALHGIGAPVPLAGLRSGAAAALGMATGSALALWISVIGEWILDKEVLGFGDVKFLGAIGAFCGWQGAVFSLFAGALVGAAALAGAEFHRRLSGGKTVQLFRLESPGGQTGRVSWGAHFPFGPMLAVAAALYFVALHPWADAYLERYLVLF